VWIGTPVSGVRAIYRRFVRAHSALRIAGLWTSLVSSKSPLKRCTLPPRRDFAILLDSLPPLVSSDFCHVPSHDLR